MFATKWPNVLDLEDCFILFQGDTSLWNLGMVAFHNKLAERTLRSFVYVTWK